MPHTSEQAGVVLVPVPFAATVSYRGGAERGPAAIRDASLQVDLHDLQTGEAWRRGIHMIDEPAELRALHARARALAAPIVAAGGAGEGDAAAVAEVDAAGDRVNAWVTAAVETVLDAGKVPGVVGGDHSVPFGAIAAAAARGPLGVLQVDAHLDLRAAYEGFTWSHASIMHNVLERLPAVERLVQVGIRDVGGSELAAARAAGPRVRTHLDLDWRRRLAAGEPLLALLDEVVETLPERVWISFDVDGLEPACCPNTGTPVPGGLGFTEACLLLERLHERGSRIAGFDLCEVSPGADGPLSGTDAMVGARLLYKLSTFALL